MTVVLANCALTALVRSHDFARDAHGTPVPDDEEEVDERGPFPCAAEENPDGSWALRLDPRMHELRAADQVSDGDRTWVLTGSPRLHAVAGVPYVDFIEASAVLDPPRVP